jgi:hypothetical protein
MSLLRGPDHGRLEANQSILFVGMTHHSSAVDRLANTFTPSVADADGEPTMIEG